MTMSVGRIDIASKELGVEISVLWRNWGSKEFEGWAF